VNTATLQGVQRTIRRGRLELVRAQDAAPELADELGEAITRALAAERKAARLLREKIAPQK